MIGKLVAVFASLVAAVALFGASASAQDVFGPTPLIYDAKNKLVGPMIQGRTYLTIDGRFYSIYIQEDKIGKSYAAFYYKDGKCSTKPYIGLFAVDLAPRIYIYKDIAYFPQGDPEFVETKSYRSVNDTGWGNKCAKHVRSGVMAPVRQEPASFLGITLPIRLAPPGAAPTNAG